MSHAKSNAPRETTASREPNTSPRSSPTTRVTTPGGETSWICDAGSLGSKNDSGCDSRAVPGCALAPTGLDSCRVTSLRALAIPAALLLMLAAPTTGSGAPRTLTLSQNGVPVTATLDPAAGMFSVAIPAASIPATGSGGTIVPIYTLTRCEDGGASTWGIGMSPLSDFADETPTGWTAFPEAAQLYRDGRAYAPASEAIAPTGATASVASDGTVTLSGPDARATTTWTSRALRDPTLDCVLHPSNTGARTRVTVWFPAFKPPPARPASKHQARLLLRAAGRLGFSRRRYHLRHVRVAEAVWAVATPIANDPRLQGNGVILFAFSHRTGHWRTVGYGSSPSLPPGMPPGVFRSLVGYFPPPGRRSS